MVELLDHLFEEAEWVLPLDNGLDSVAEDTNVATNKMHSNLVTSILCMYFIDDDCLIAAPGPALFFIRDSVSLSDGSSVSHYTFLKSNQLISVTSDLIS